MNDGNNKKRGVWGKEGFTVLPCLPLHSHYTLLGTDAENGRYLMKSVSQLFTFTEASRSHSDTPRSVGLLWTSDKPDVEILYLTTHDTHKRQTSMPLAGFEPAIPASEWPQIHALDRAATGTGTGKALRYALLSPASWRRMAAGRYNATHSLCQHCTRWS